MPASADALILSLLLSAGAAQAPNTVTRETTTVATVDRIDQADRVLTAHSQGQGGKVSHTFKVDPMNSRWGTSSPSATPNRWSSRSGRMPS